MSQEFALLASFQVMLLLLARGPHFENYWARSHWLFQVLTIFQQIGLWNKDLSRIRKLGIPTTSSGTTRGSMNTFLAFETKQNHPWLLEDGQRQGSSPWFHYRSCFWEGWVREGDRDRTSFLLGCLLRQVPVWEGVCFRTKDSDRELLIAAEVVSGCDRLGMHIRCFHH